MKIEATARLTATGSKPATLFIAKVKYPNSQELDTVIVSGNSKEEAKAHMDRKFQEMHTKYKAVSFKAISKEQASKLIGAIEWY